MKNVLLCLSFLLIAQPASADPRKQANQIWQGIEITQSGQEERTAALLDKQNKYLELGLDTLKTEDFETSLALGEILKPRIGNDDKTRLRWMHLRGLANYNICELQSRAPLCSKAVAIFKEGKALAEKTGLDCSACMELNGAIALNQLGRIRDNLADLEKSREMALAAAKGTERSTNPEFWVGASWRAAAYLGDVNRRLKQADLTKQATREFEALLEHVKPPSPEWIRVQNEFGLMLMEAGMDTKGPDSIAALKKARELFQTGLDKVPQSNSHARAFFASNLACTINHLMSRTKDKNLAREAIEPARFAAEVYKRVNDQWRWAYSAGHLAIATLTIARLDQDKAEQLTARKQLKEAIRVMRKENDGYWANYFSQNAK
jgi:hypothetical protein